MFNRSLLCCRLERSVVPVFSLRYERWLKALSRSISFLMIGSQCISIFLLIGMLLLICYFRDSNKSESQLPLIGVLLLGGSNPNVLLAPAHIAYQRVPKCILPQLAIAHCLRVAFVIDGLQIAD